MSKRNPRIKSGQMIIELMLVLFLASTLMLALVDLVTVFAGVLTNCSICREAARVASVGPPDAIVKDGPRKRIASILNRWLKISGPIKFRPNFAVEERISAALPQPPFGGDVVGDISATTTVEIEPPISTRIFGWHHICFSYKQTFPYTWSMPETYQTN